MPRGMKINGTLALGLVAVLGWAIGCGSAGPTSTGTVPEPLETITITEQQSTAQSGSFTGALSVTGEGRDLVLSISSGAATTAVSLHSPASSPLAALAGEGRTVEIVNEAFEAGPSLFITDDAGAAYAAVAGDRMALQAAEQRFGAGFVRYGDVVGSETTSTFIWTYRKAVFKTDGGEVALSPGQVRALSFGGSLYRVVVITSYQATTNPDADVLPDCGPEDLLGFEMARVAKPLAETGDLHRLAGGDAAFAGCSVPPSVRLSDD
jgi:hypothetical protein